MPAERIKACLDAVLFDVLFVRTKEDLSCMVNLHASEKDAGRPSIVNSNPVVIHTMSIPGCELALCPVDVILDPPRLPASSLGSDALPSLRICSTLLPSHPRGVTP